MKKKIVKENEWSLKMSDEEEVKSVGRTKVALEVNSRVGNKD